MYTNLNVNHVLLFFVEETTTVFPFGPNGNAITQFYSCRMDLAIESWQHLHMDQSILQPSL